MNITKRIEDAIQALEKGQLKQALYLTERDKLSEHHQWIEEAARTCLANKNNKAICQAAVNEAKAKLQATITPPMEDTSLEGLEEYMTDKPTQEKTNEELYEECEECHIANAIAAASEICEQHPQTVCSLIWERIDKEDVGPEEWLKTLVQAVDKSEGVAKKEMATIVNDLVEYLDHRNSPFLKALKEEELDLTGD